MNYNDDIYKVKYLKYKNKYFNLLNGGNTGKCDCGNNNNCICLIGGNKLTVKNNKLAIENVSINKLNNNSIMLFKADWCPHCRNFMPEWKKLTNDISNVINCITYDSEKNKEEIENYNIDGFPSIKIKIQEEIIEYNGRRTASDIKGFLKSNDII